MLYQTYRFMQLQIINERVRVLKPDKQFKTGKNFRKS